MFSGFGGYILSVIIAYFIQRYILKNPGQRGSQDTFFVLLFIPVANIIISLIFLLMSKNAVDQDWIRKNFYQIKD
jgi:hypothetical protein